MIGGHQGFKINFVFGKSLALMFGKRTDMKTLIIFYHPYDGSYCWAILKAVQEGLKRGGHPHKTIDLLRDVFDSVMHEKDLQAFAVYGRTGDITQSDVDPLVLHYKKKLEWAGMLAC